jgi:serine phosphatase RsbU (regulator of sigma subunit)/ligand-binding sensor domain-containing protein
VKKNIIIAILCLVFRFISFSQEGSYYINNYTPSVYGTGDQNWGIVQDSLGRLFVANIDAVMMYDGKYWQTLGITEGKAVSSVSKTNNNVILVGGEGDFGYLNFGDSGKIKYISLSAFLPHKENEFGKIWAIHAIDSNRFYCANEKIFWYKGNNLEKIFKPTGEKFHTFFKVDNTLLVREQGVGFLFFKDGQLKKIKNTEEFADTRVYAILPFKNNLYWVCSRKGLYILKYNKRNPEHSSISKINAPVADSWMIENDIYCGAKINDNLYALGSIKKGVLLVDNAFNSVNRINYSQSGLQEDAVKYIYLDYAGNLWLALNKGLSHVQINTPLTYWNKINGIRGTIESIAKLDKTFYIASDKGIDKLNTVTNVFESTKIKDVSWDIIPYNNLLLAGTNTGIYEITPSSEEKIFDTQDGVYKIYVNPTNKEQLFIAGENSLLLVKYNNHTISIIKEYDYATGIRSIAADVKGRVFFGFTEVYMFDPTNPDTLTKYTEKEGILPTVENYVFNYNKEILIATQGGILQFQDKPEAKFIRSNKYNIFKGNVQMHNALQVGDDIWLSLLNISDNIASMDGDGVTILKYTPTGFVKEYKFFKQIKSLKAHCFLADSDKVYIGTNDGLIAYDLKQKHKDYTFNTFIYKIAQKTDTNAISGNFYEGLKYTEPVFSYKNNEITFYPSASDYYDKNELEFSWYLEGLEDDYCVYTKQDKIPYHNLHEGHYIFHLKSRNILGIEGKLVNYAFTISAPWYRTFWAYIIYVLGSIASITFIVRYNTKRLKEQNIKLEKIITERTKTVEHQKEEIEYKNKEITDSINYAKRIQQAILPPVADIKRVYQNLFVFFQPKDIVSGDFYWFHKINNNEILIACADCTGHGVPGGFMSMICSDKLNDAVKLTQNPAEILFHVNNNVKMALRQTETSDENVNKDGMEISLVRINFSQQKVWFAGANRPLWLLKNKSEEIEEIKPTKASIASFTKVDFEYQGHELLLETGDLVYLTSDGYPDQFGGADGKKFMTKNFKKLILSIKHLDIPEQEITVKNIINQWMEGYEQVDDLLVIGFKM